MATRHEEIADALRDAINNGTWPVGAALPPETELAITYGASRGTVRHALAGLAADGLISPQQLRVVHRATAGAASRPATRSCACRPPA